MKSTILSIAFSALAVVSVPAFADSPVQDEIPADPFNVSIKLVDYDGADAESDRLVYTALNTVTGEEILADRDTEVLTLAEGTYVIKGESNFCFTEEKTFEVTEDTVLSLIVGCE